MLALASLFTAFAFATQLGVVAGLPAGRSGPARRQASEFQFREGPYRIALPSDHSTVWGPVLNKTTGVLSLQITDYVPSAEAAWFNITPTSVPSEYSGYFDTAYTLTTLGSFGGVAYSSDDGFVPVDATRPAFVFGIDCQVVSPTLSSNCTLLAEGAPVVGDYAFAKPTLGSEVGFVTMGDCQWGQCVWDIVKAEPAAELDSALTLGTQLVAGLPAATSLEPRSSRPHLRGPLQDRFSCCYYSWGPERNKTTGLINLELLNYVETAPAAWFNVTPASASTYNIVGNEGFGYVSYLNGLLASDTIANALPFSVNCAVYTDEISTKCTIIAQGAPVEGYYVANTGVIGSPLEFVTEEGCQTANCAWNLVNV
ncbi:hypothetical protein MNV49_001282 [Pseudohyphozyma bogoriensis]|nr:hypothetical protein MNV49_001282 [Pseudohyphozyma bogoriensis]